MSLAFEELGTLAPEDTISVLEETLPKPSDRKIADGEALQGKLTAGQLLAVELRLEKVFGIINNDQSREAGECIAYGLGLSVEEETVVDHHLIFQAAAMLSRDAAGSVIARNSITDEDNMSADLWAGRTKERDYRLRKHLSRIILDDGTIEMSGIVYGLLSTRR